MNTKIIIGGIILVFILLAVWSWSINRIPGPKVDLDGFASCLSAKNITMYGAAWCPHCQNEKKNFGKSFKLVKYVECPENQNLCLLAGVNSYPTWILGDGRKFVGEQGLSKLSELSSCPLPEGAL